MVNDSEFPIVVFEDSSKDKILNLLGLKKEDSNILDNNNQVIINSEYEPVEIDEFGGILIGSKRAIKKDSIELVKYFLDKDLK